MPRTAHGAGVTSVAFSPDGSRVATAGRDGVIHVWDRATGKGVLRLDGSAGRRPQAAFSGDGRRINSWGAWDDQELRIFDAATGATVARHTVAGEYSRWEAVSGDGKTAVSSLGGKTIRSHELPSGKITRELATPSPVPVALSPTADRMVLSDGSLVNAADHKPIGNVGRVYHLNPSVSFGVDGRTLVAAVVTKSPHKAYQLHPAAEELAVFDARAGKELRRFGKGADRFRAIDAATLSRDGRMAVSVSDAGDTSNEQVVTLWEVETGRERGRFRGHFGSGTSVALSADGRFVVTGADDTTALVWDTRKATIASVPPAEGLAALLNRLADDDAESAYSAMQTLVEASGKSLRLFAGRRDLFARADAKDIQSWVSELDGNKFATRERAMQALRAVLDEAGPHLTKALGADPSVEARSRIDTLLGEREAGFAGRELQKLRVIEVAERIALFGDAATRREAVELLKTFADGAPDARLTEEAMAALGRSGP